MKMGGMFLAAIVLAALSGVLYWSNHHAPTEAAGGGAISAPTKILALSPADITAIKIKRKDQDEVVLAKAPSGQWQIAMPKIVEADQDAAEAVAGALTPLNADRVVEDKASDLKPFGLSDPAIELDITEKDSKTQKLLIGDNTPLGGGAYATLAGDPRVFTISSSVVTSLAKGPAELRDARLLRVSADKISRVELNARKQDILFERTKDSWQIDKPPAVRADPMPVDELARQLESAKFDASQPSGDSKTAAAFSSSSPVATVTVTVPAGTQELEIRKNKDDYYAKSSVVDGVYKVPTELGKAFDKGLDDFRNKKLFDIGLETPSKVEMHDGTRTYSFTRSGQDWSSSNGTKMGLVDTLVLADKIRNLSAEKPVNSGFTTPAIDVTITASDGKRVEKVLISKNGSGYIAKREGEPGFYELSAASVQELQQAAANVKPAAATPQGGQPNQ
jgi:hypothetical protein